MDIFLITIINTIVGAITTALIVYFLSTKKVDKVADLLHRFIDHFNKNVPLDLQFYNEGSPLKLNEGGVQAIQESGIDAYIDAHIQEYEGAFDGLREVQIFDRCKEIARGVLQQDSTEALNIREYFYNKSIEENIMTNIFALALRDAVLKEQKVERAR